MGVLRSLARAVATRVSDRVAQDELFEKPGERPPQAPLAPNEPQPAARGSKLEPGTRAVAVGALRKQLRGVRVVHHWATWCAPCEEELPQLQALHQDTGAVVGVSWDAFQDPAPADTIVRKVRSYEQAHGIAFPSLIVQGSPEDFFAALDLDTQTVPQTHVFDDEGGVILRIRGPVDEESLKELRRLL